MKKFTISLLTIAAFSTALAKNEVAPNQTVTTTVSSYSSPYNYTNPTNKKPKKERKVAAFRYEIVNAEGVIVEQKNLTYSPSEYDFSNLTEGQYVIHVYYHNTLIASKKYLLK
jgi:hypothetical protein